MRDRINAAQLGEFVRAALDLRKTTHRSALTMHEIVNHAWAPGVSLPEIATKETLRKIGEVRKSLIVDEGHVVAPIALAYFALMKGKVFTEIEAAQCLPRKSAPQMGFLFIDGESSPKDTLVWAEWVKREAVTANSRGSEVGISVKNAVRSSLLTELESEKLLAIEAGPAETADTPRPDDPPDADSRTVLAKAGA